MNFTNHTTLGRTGLSVSRLGFGASYPAPAHSLEKAFHEKGLNFFLWGSGRRAPMADALRNLTRFHRDDVVVAFQTYDKSGMLMRRFHEKGLRRLGIDHVDLLLMSWMRGVPRGGMLSTALKLKEEGKVRYLGISTHDRPLAGRIAADPQSPVDVLMVRYNAAHTGAEKDIFPHIPSENPPGIISFTATRWGRLVNPKKMPPGEKPLTAADCYRFALSSGHVDVCLTGPRTAAELDENMAALDLGPLSEEEMERVRRIGRHVYGK
ncbi:MAG: aldo/keto reductase [bacterium]|nr:aldo/keto reductase [bacterium]